MKQMDQPPNALRRVAPEIRDMIFKYVLTLRSRPRTSLSLLAALRTVPELYYEALEVYYKVNTFLLGVKSFRGFSRLKAGAVQLITQMRIVLMYVSQRFRLRISY